MDSESSTVPAPAAAPAPVLKKQLSMGAMLRKANRTGNLAKAVDTLPEEAPTNANTSSNTSNNSSTAKTESQQQAEKAMRDDGIAAWSDSTTEVTSAGLLVHPAISSSAASAAAAAVHSASTSSTNSVTIAAAAATSSQQQNSSQPSPDPKTQPAENNNTTTTTTEVATTPKPSFAKRSSFKLLLQANKTGALSKAVASIPDDIDSPSKPKIDSPPPAASEVPAVEEGEEHQKKQNEEDTDKDKQEETPISSPLSSPLPLPPKIEFDHPPKNPLTKTGSELSTMYATTVTSPFGTEKGENESDLGEMEDLGVAPPAVNILTEPLNNATISITGSAPVAFPTNSNGSSGEGGIARTADAPTASLVSNNNIDLNNFAARMDAASLPQNPAAASSLQQQVTTGISDDVHRIAKAAAELAELAHAEGAKTGNRDSFDGSVASDDDDDARQEKKMVECLLGIPAPGFTPTSTGLPPESQTEQVRRRARVLHRIDAWRPLEQCKKLEEVAKLIAQKSHPIPDPMALLEHVPQGEESLSRIVRQQPLYQGVDLGQSSLSSSKTSPLLASYSPSGRSGSRRPGSSLAASIDERRRAATALPPASPMSLPPRPRTVIGMARPGTSESDLGERPSSSLSVGHRGLRSGGGRRGGNDDFLLSSSKKSLDLSLDRRDWPAIGEDESMSGGDADEEDETFWITGGNGGKGMAGSIRPSRLMHIPRGEIINGSISRGQIREYRISTPAASGKTAYLVHFLQPQMLTHDLVAFIRSGQRASRAAHDDSTQWLGLGATAEQIFALGSEEESAVFLTVDATTPQHHFLSFQFSFIVLEQHHTEDLLETHRRRALRREKKMHTAEIKLTKTSGELELDYYHVAPLASKVKVRPWPAVVASLGPNGCIDTHITQPRRTTRFGQDPIWNDPPGVGGPAALVRQRPWSIFDHYEQMMQEMEFDRELRIRKTIEDPKVGIQRLQRAMQQTRGRSMPADARAQVSMMEANAQSNPENNNNHRNRFDYNSRNFSGSFAAGGGAADREDYQFRTDNYYSQVDETNFGNARVSSPKSPFGGNVDNTSSNYNNDSPSESKKGTVSSPKQGGGGGGDGRSSTTTGSMKFPTSSLPTLLGVKKIEATNNNNNSNNANNSSTTVDNNNKNPESDVLVMDDYMQQVLESDTAVAENITARSLPSSSEAGDVLFFRPDSQGQSFRPQKLRERMSRGHDVNVSSDDDSDSRRSPVNRSPSTSQQRRADFSNVSDIEVEEDKQRLHRIMEDANRRLAIVAEADMQLQKVNWSQEWPQTEVPTVESELRKYQRWVASVWDRARHYNGDRQELPFTRPQTSIGMATTFDSPPTMSSSPQKMPKDTTKLRPFLPKKANTPDAQRLLKLRVNLQSPTMLDGNGAKGRPFSSSTTSRPGSNLSSKSGKEASLFRSLSQQHLLQQQQQQQQSQLARSQPLPRGRQAFPTRSPVKMELEVSPVPLNRASPTLSYTAAWNRK